MSKCVNYKLNAPEDQLICLTCGEREKSRHNVPCMYCGSMMVYERAWAQLKAGNENPEPTFPDVPEIAAEQMALF